MIHPTLYRNGTLVRGWQRKGRPEEVAVIASWDPIPFAPNGTVTFFVALKSGGAFVPGNSLNHVPLRRFCRLYEPRNP